MTSPRLQQTGPVAHLSGGFPGKSNCSPLIEKTIRRLLPHLTEVPELGHPARLPGTKKLGDRDSNPDTTVQSRMSYHWTISQYLNTSIGTRSVRVYIQKSVANIRKTNPLSSGLAAKPLL
jgi:hypothetical protein